MAVSVRQTVQGMGTRANPAFAVAAVAVPLAALAYALTMGSLQQHTYVHVMAGVLWTGIDLFMAMVLGPVLGGLPVEERSTVFQRFTPKMTFLMPTLAFVTIAGGITLALRGPWVFPHAHVWLAILTAATLLPALALIGWQFDALTDWRWLTAFASSLLGLSLLHLSEPPRLGMISYAVFFFKKKKKKRRAEEEGKERQRLYSK